MKDKFIAFFALAMLVCLASVAQRPDPVKKNLSNSENPNIKVTPSTITIADTTNIKLNKLVNDFNSLKAENNTLNQDIAALKTTISSLTSRAADTQKDIVALKLLMQGVDNSIGGIKKISPVAYASFEPEKATTGGYSYKIAAQYGIKGAPVQVYSSVTITLANNILGKPVIVAAAGEDHINTSAISKTAAVIYDFIAPNKIRLTLKGDVIAPFSFVVYESIE